MKKITEFDFNNKKTILRLDLNVPIKDGKILSKDKITSSLKTIISVTNRHLKQPPGLICALYL